VVEALATHRDQRQMDENALHNKHNIVNFLLKRARLAECVPDITGADIIRCLHALPSTSSSHNSVP
jgi:hypothetical protein